MALIKDKWFMGTFKREDNTNNDDDEKKAQAAYFNDGFLRCSKAQKCEV